MGVLVRQWKTKQSAKTGDWTVGKDCLGPDVQASGLRTFKNEKAFENDPIMGTDIQPKHYDDKYKGSQDYGGVHINSGIPNHAFYLVATELGGKAWVRAGKIWYDTLFRLHSQSDFADMVGETITASVQTYGSSSKETRAVKKAWRKVGLY
jgi:Zn-dependent metalloprotease